MTNCKHITKNGRCGLKDSYAYRHGCFGEDMCRCREPMTNADRIRDMSDDELAGFLMKLMGHAQCFAEGMFPYHPCPQEQNCKQCGIEWLQQPAEEDGHAICGATNLPCIRCNPGGCDNRKEGADNEP